MPAKAGELVLTDEQREFANANLKLAYRFGHEWCVRRGRTDAHSVADAQQVAVLELCRAAACFDPARGTKFSTLAYRFMLSGLTRMGLHDRRAARLSPLGFEPPAPPPDRDPWEAEEARQAVEQIRQLCEPYQLKLLDGLLGTNGNFAELGRVLGHSSSAVHGRVKTLRRRLARLGRAS
jgi:DNA-directed RNA polymerase specialized sigma24 family protein